MYYSAYFSTAVREADHSQQPIAPLFPSPRDPFLFPPPFLRIPWLPLSLPLPMERLARRVKEEEEEEEEED